MLMLRYTIQFWVSKQSDVEEVILSRGMRMRMRMRKDECVVCMCVCICDFDLIPSACYVCHRTAIFSTVIVTDDAHVVSSLNAVEECNKPTTVSGER